MNHYAELKLRINTKISDIEKIKEMIKPITEFGNKHDIGIYSEFDMNDNYIYAEIIATGLTTRYCRGAVHEVKQMYKDIFKCKIDTLLEMY